MRNKRVISIAAAMLVLAASLLVAVRLSARIPGRMNEHEPTVPSEPPSLVLSAQPKVVWTPGSVERTLTRGITAGSDVTFTSDQSLDNIAIEAVPEIAPFITITPTTLVSVAANTPQRIHLTFSIPANALFGEYDGTVHIRVGSTTLPQTEKITVAVSQTPVALPIPTGFQPNQQVLSQSGPVLLNNFNSQYQQGGLVPPGGAEISVASFPLPRPPLGDLIANELRGATITSTASIRVSGSSCTEVFYSDSYGTGSTFLNVVVYCPHNQTLYKLFLTYRGGDSSANTFLSAFQQVLSTIQFVL